MAASNNPQQWSPKVIAIPIVGIILFAISSGLATVTPEMFTGLGPWAVPAAVVLTTLGAGGLAWWRTDPLRIDFFQQQAAHETAAAEQAAAAESEAAETTVSDEDDYQGKHVAVPILYDTAEIPVGQVVRGYVAYSDGSDSPVERWVRRADGAFISLDSERGQGWFDAEASDRFVQVI